MADEDINLVTTETTPATSGEPRGDENNQGDELWVTELPDGEKIAPVNVNRFFGPMLTPDPDYKPVKRRRSPRKKTDAK